jgi:hypothetical protein
VPTTHDRGLLSPVEPAGSNDPAVRIVEFFTSCDPQARTPGLVVPKQLGML